MKKFNQNSNFFTEKTVEVLVESQDICANTSSNCIALNLESELNS